MDLTMALIFKMAGIGLLTQVTSTILSTSGKSEYSELINIAGIAISLSILIPKIYSVFENVTAMFKLI